MGQRRRMTATGRYSPFTVCCRAQVWGRPPDGTWTRQQAAGAVRATALRGDSVQGTGTGRSGQEAIYEYGSVTTFVVEEADGCEL